MATVEYKRNAWIRRANIRFFVAETEFDRSMSKIVNGAKNAKTITFPRTVRTCRGREASYLSSRTAVLNERLKIIGLETFHSSKLKRIIIPKSVEEIQDNAFEYCKNLKEVVFEAGSALKKIGDCAFCNCTSLRNI